MFDNKSQREVQKLKQNSHIFYDFCVNISPLLVDRGTQDGKDSFFPKSAIVQQLQ